jgi:hypothetical protein
VLIRCMKWLSVLKFGVCRFCQKKQYLARLVIRVTCLAHLGWQTGLTLLLGECLISSWGRAWRDVGDLNYVIAIVALMEAVSLFCGIKSVRKDPMSITEAMLLKDSQGYCRELV